MSVRLLTNLGELEIKLYTKEAPCTTRNFLKLCKLKYYHWCIFHRVERDFIAQTGDPTGTGTGGARFEAVLDPNSQLYFPDEINKNLGHAGKGVISMASGGKNRNGSQFFITLRDRPLEYLDGKHTVFGQVERKSWPVLDKINGVPCDQELRPLIDVYLKDVIVAPG